MIVAICAFVVLLICAIAIEILRHNALIQKVQTIEKETELTKRQIANLIEESQLNLMATDAILSVILNTRKPNHENNNGVLQKGNTVTQGS